MNLGSFGTLGQTFGQNSRTWQTSEDKYFLTKGQKRKTAKQPNLAILDQILKKLPSAQIWSNHLDFLYVIQYNMDL